MFSLTVMNTIFCNLYSHMGLFIKQIRCSSELEISFMYALFGFWQKPHIKILKKKRKLFTNKTRCMYRVVVAHTTNPSI